MVERHWCAETVAPADAQSCAAQIRVVHQVVMGEQHALRRASCARGVLNVDHVVDACNVWRRLDAVLNHPGPVFGPQQDRMLELQVLIASRLFKDFPIVGACVTLV